MFYMLLFIGFFLCMTVEVVAKAFELILVMNVCKKSVFVLIFVLMINEIFMDCENLRSGHLQYK